MLKLVLDHKKIKGLMREKRIRNQDIADLMGISQQLASYRINRGSARLTEKFAKILECSEKDLTKVKVIPVKFSLKLKLPKGVSIVNNRIRGIRKENE